ncbi:transposable element Tc1 transposase [Trichonephila clavipes]|nr:transposable element Tc1 transposase [Trichonephila clavipes]
MRIYHRWMQELTLDRLCLSQPPLCATVLDDRWIVPMAVMDHVTTSRVIAQQIQFFTHYSVSAPTIRLCLQQSGTSARRPLLHLPLTENHWRLRSQWCSERRSWTPE